MINGRTYYYLQKTYREKIENSGAGKTKGSGKSRVRTQSIYLGTAQSIMERLNRAREPVEARHREFGLSAAALQCAQEIGLCDLLKEHIKGERYGIPRWLYFLLPVLNRLSHATSKEQLGKWAAKTVLPDLLGFDPGRLNSKTFWYATEDVISEKELRKRRQEAPALDDELFAGLDDSVFLEIEQSLFANLRERFHFSTSAFLYDTTNFFTYIEEPVRSKLARPGHNKECRHHLKQVGLAMCVDKEWGLPLFHRLYRGNSQDAGTFAGLVDDLILSLRAGFDKVDDLVLVLDKGNNSKENFAALKVEERLNTLIECITPENKEIISEKMVALRRERDNLKGEMDDATQIEARVVESKKLAGRLVELSGKLKELWPVAELSEKKEFISLLVDSISISGKRKIAQIFSEF